MIALVLLIFVLVMIRLEYDRYQLRKRRSGYLPVLRGRLCSCPACKQARNDERKAA